MANVVEILIKARDDASRVMRQVATEATGMNAAITSTGGGFAAAALAAATLGTAAFGMARQLADAVEQLDRMADNTGVAQGNLQVMRQIVKEAGGDFGSITAALSFFNRQVGESNPLLAKLGITTKDAYAGFMQLAGILVRMEDVGRRAALMQALLGRGSREMVADLKAIVPGMEAMNASMTANGSKIADEMLPRMRELDKQLDALGQSFEGLWKSIAVGAAPAAAAAIAALNEIIEARQRFGKTGKDDPFGLHQFDKKPPGMLSAHGNQPFVDPTKGLDLTKGDKAEASPREKRLADLMRILRQTHAEAERTLKSLEAIEDREKAMKVMESLRSPFDSTGRTDTSSDAKLRGQADPTFKVDDIVKVPELQLDALTKVREQWRAFAQDVLSTASILNDSLGALHEGLQAGFSSVFQNLLSEGQTFKSAFLTIINSLVSAALQELARIAAAKVFLFILSAAGSGLPTEALAGISRSTAPGSVGRDPGRTTNVYINALDNKSVGEAMTTPFGSLRAAQARTAEAFG